MRLVADRPGQIRVEVQSKYRKRVETQSVWIEKGELFEMNCQLDNAGQPRIPRWAHVPEGEELKSIEARKLAEHKKAGDARAVPEAPKEKIGGKPTGKVL